MNLIKLFLLASLTFASTTTQAVLISASDYEVGTVITQLDSNTTVNFVQKRTGITEILPLTVQPKAFWGNRDVHNFSGISWGLHYAAHLDELPVSLDELLADGRGFSAVLITYTTPTTQLTVNGFTPFGEDFIALSFDENGNFLEYLAMSASRIKGLLFRGTFRFEEPAYYVMIGGRDGATYIESIDATLPEPSPLLLFVLGGITFVLRSRRYNHHISTFHISA